MNCIKGFLGLVVIALIVAVASVTSVGFFTDRIQRALEQQSNELLGADLVVNASHPLSKDLQIVAASFKARSAQTAEFPSMVIAGGVPCAFLMRYLPAMRLLRVFLQLVQYGLNHDWSLNLELKWVIRLPWVKVTSLFPQS